MGWALIRIHLIVNQTPLLKEGVYAHDGANVTGKVASAGSDGEVLDGVQSVGIDHEVAVVLVHRRSLATITVVKELGESLALDLVRTSACSPESFSCPSTPDELPLPCGADFRSRLGQV
jgi:hypothetical protein